MNSNAVHVAQPTSVTDTFLARDVSLGTRVFLSLNSLLPISSAETFSLDTCQAVPAEVRVEPERSSVESVHVCDSVVVPSVTVVDTPSLSSSFVVNDPLPNFSESDVASSFSNISVFHMNIRGWRSHCNELEAYLEVLDEKPKIIAITETFLNRGCNANLFGYKLIGRRDRPTTSDCFTDSLQSWGGILVFVLKEYEGSIVQLHISECAERIWLMIHSDVGPVLFGVCYRPPSPGNIEFISTLATELVTFRKDVIGAILVGDFNCHHIRWLKFSSGISLEGKALHRFSMNYGLEQTVRGPTRGEYLLDLVLTDLGDSCSTRVLPNIADHHGVLASFKFSLQMYSCPPRTVWCYRSADWAGFHEFLNEQDYRFLTALDVDTATEKFTHLLLEGCELFIKKKVLPVEISALPWLSDRSKDAIQKKHALLNTPEYAKACLDCSEILNSDFHLYVSTIKERMSNMRRGSKEYWSLVKKLMLGSNHKLSVPTLKSGDITASIATEKAGLFANTFQAKWFVPDIQQNSYSFDFPDFLPQENHLLQFRSRHARFHLSTLEKDSATGPDGLSTILLRMLAAIICRPFAILAQRIVQCGVWPRIWKLHWVFPLFKRGVRSLPSNYRGLHLTSQLSKCMERFIGFHFMGKLSLSFGSSQFAYRKFHGSRDALTYAILTWLLAFATGKKVALYNSDVAAAFDRVSSLLLLKKLRSTKIDSCILRLIASWLRGRTGQVTVHGCTSSYFPLSDMTFQGTVWGPCLWNAFFADVVFPCRFCAFEQIIFADDFNCFRFFDNNIDIDFVLGQLSRVQDEVHKWGAANGVTFEASKESFHILSRVHHFGESFRVLGVTFDTQLIMSEAIGECAQECHWRLSALLRTRRYFSVVDLVLQYKSQVLSYLEYRTAVVSHAADIHLHLLDSVQRRFLDNIDITDLVAFQQFNLAPLCARRDIANLGIIFRAVTRRGPKKLWPFFTLDNASRRSSPRWRFHRFQVADTYRALNRDYINRSTLGYIGIFNLLPDVVFVDEDGHLPISVQSFQRNLTRLLRTVSVSEILWQELFSPRSPLVGHVLHDYQNLDMLAI